MPENPVPLMTFEQRGAITLASVASTTMLDGANVPRFGSEVIDYVRAHPNVQMLLNFEKVDYMSSSALTEILRINQALKDAQGSVRLCGLTPNIRNVFQITNLEKLFVIHEDDSVDKAYKRFERSLAVAVEEDAWGSPDADA